MLTINNSNNTKLVLQGTVDSTNNPSLVILGNITLPSNTVISLKGEKVLAMSTILDGVSVIERIMRDPYEINLEFDLWEVRNDSSLNNDGTISIFPQDLLDDIFQNVWIVNTILSIQNTYLNKLGVQEVVVKSISPLAVRGSKKISTRIMCFENVPGQTLNLNTTPNGTSAGSTTTNSTTA